MAKNSQNSVCANCANLGTCKQTPKTTRKDGLATCHITPKPHLQKHEARRLYGDGADLNGSPSISGGYK